MSEAHFEYKCRRRRCGVISVNPICALEYAQAELSAALGRCKHFLGGHQPELFGVHVCEDGGTGVTDLLGFKKVEEAKEKSRSFEDWKDRSLLLQSNEVGT